MSQDTGASISAMTPGGLSPFIERMRHDWNAHPLTDGAHDAKAWEVGQTDVNLLLDKLDHMRQVAQNLIDSGSPMDYKPSDEHPGERMAYCVSPELYELLRRVIA